MLGVIQRRFRMPIACRRPAGARGYGSPETGGTSVGWPRRPRRGRLSRVLTAAPSRPGRLAGILDHQAAERAARGTDVAPRAETLVPTGTARKDGNGFPPGGWFST